jgi:1,4-dihydroxy-2-naphthoate octaprenyltransferase
MAGRLRGVTPPTSAPPSGLRLWIAGARPRTLPAAIAPVIAGTGVAAHHDAFVWWRALLALGVSLALQIGVNFANDYSDGVAGTDKDRVGPLRLVGSGMVAPGKVKAAALGFLVLGGTLGFALAATTTWWLLGVGAAALLAAWTYTGGPVPYGYRALGEVSVFVFFGLVAVLGTVYVQAERLGWDAWAVAVGLGALACAILVANNLRDIPTDIASGKRTLAVVLGDGRTRLLFVAMFAVALIAAVCLAWTTSWFWLTAAASPFASRAVTSVRVGASGPALIEVLQNTARAELLYAIGIGLALALG